MSGKSSWKRDNLRLKFSAACSIEETGLDTPHYDGGLAFYSPRLSTETQISTADVITEDMVENGQPKNISAQSNLFHAYKDYGGKLGKQDTTSKNAFLDRMDEMGRSRIEKRRSREGFGKLGIRQETTKKVNNSTFGCPNYDDSRSMSNLASKGSEVTIQPRIQHPSRNKVQIDFSSLSSSIGTTVIEAIGISTDTRDLGIPNHAGQPTKDVMTPNLPSELSPVFNFTQSMSPLLEDSNPLSQFANQITSPQIGQSKLGSSNASPHLTTTTVPGSLYADAAEAAPSQKGPTEPVGNSNETNSQTIGARNRWRRLKHTVAFANHMAANIRSAPNDLLEEKHIEELLQQQSSLKEDAGGMGAAMFEGAKTGFQSRAKGRKGMEGLFVHQDKSVISYMQDFYVACLKMSFGYFLIGVFLAPVALALVFTPLLLFDMDGLTYQDVMGADDNIVPLSEATQNCFGSLSAVFLYALSLSTTFNGSPVAAFSPYCLLVANVNTLMAQFLFVFLSGAVFARMSQPSHPIRCSKKAIIRRDDFIPNIGEENNKKFRVFAVRLVLTGPPPCELVDAKICLTFRIFVKLPTGLMFCSTQDLELVRPEVSYLRYGLMVRHIIDKKSPVYGHSMESLIEGDASFSLTVMGLERTSMQPIFHLEDYFAYDGDVEWDGDYLDFIHTNDRGQRILDHSKIDQLKHFKVVGTVSRAITRMEAGVKLKANAHNDNTNAAKQRNSERNEVVETSPLRRWVGQIHHRKLWKSLSTSFTRADW